jgi:DEAD/DEAH box helicase domain-containing protein
MASDSNGFSFADELLTELRAWTECHEQIVSCHSQPARAPVYASVDEQIRRVLPREIGNLYRHQALAIDYALRGEHLTLATATASGKTLALALPSRIRRSVDQQASLLCIAPTRALVEQWKELLQAWDKAVVVEAYTGDTPQHERAAIRKRVQCLVTTPDMVHRSLLPHHRFWGKFLARLQDIIIDESHIYRGVFGSHMGHILRRLRRVVALYCAAPPTFLFASATIGNAVEHASHLLNLPVSVITENGAPSGGRRIVLWQPPDKRNHSDEAASLMAFYLSRNIRTILFGQARQSVERMARYVRGQLPFHLRGRVVPYRGGYMPEERRAMQRQLATGELLGVVTTNALELGIDIGGLDVSILDGFPGSIASFWQQAGRAGRQGRSALTIFVLREDALDQYFASHPDTLLGQPAERALINVGNPYILPAHLLLAANERPLETQKLSLFGHTAHDAVADLVEQGRLYERAGKYYVCGQESNLVDLRQVGQRLIISHAGKKIEDADVHQAVGECYPGAVYFSQGISYLVEHLDLEKGKIHVIPRETDYYTEPLGNTDVEILCTAQHLKRKNADLYVGDVLVTQQVTGFVKRHEKYHSVLDKEEFADSLETRLETKAFWIMIDDPLMDDLMAHAFDPAGTLHATEHAMIALLPLFVLGDRRDVGGVSIVPAHPQTEKATIFIYDGYPGGMGYAEEAYRQFEALAQATLEAVAACSCEGGCYACVQSPKCGNQNRPLDKSGAIYLLQTLLR